MRSTHRRLRGEQVRRLNRDDIVENDQLQTIDLHKSYRKGSIEVPVLRGVSLSVRRGEFLAIVGQSGSGKSTLLHLLGTLDAPDQGEIYYAGRRIDNLAAKARDTLRNRQFGMIFQFYHLLPELNTLENVLTPLMITHGVWGFLRHRRPHRARAEELLEMVGLSHRLKHRPCELSGGKCSGRPSPGPWWPNPTCCWPTSPPATSTRAPAKRSSASCEP